MSSTQNHLLWVLASPSLQGCTTIIMSKQPSKSKNPVLSNSSTYPER